MLEPLARACGSGGEGQPVARHGLRAAVGRADARTQPCDRIAAPDERQRVRFAGLHLVVGIAQAALRLQPGEERLLSAAPYDLHLDAGDACAIAVKHHDLNAPGSRALLADDLARAEAHLRP